MIDDEVVATFTDENPSQPAGLYTATIDWGVVNGNHVVTNGVVRGTDGVFTVSATYDTYWGGQGLLFPAGPGALYPVVTVSDGEGATDSATDTVEMSTYSAGLVTGLQVGPFAYVGTWTESTEGFSATIDWGDEVVQAAVLHADAGNEYFVVEEDPNNPHWYLEPGEYTVTVTVTDPGDDSAWTSAEVTVGYGDARGYSGGLLAYAGLELEEVVVADFSDITPEESEDDFTATIDWGDGTEPEAADDIVWLGSTLRVLGSHTYQAVGGYHRVYAWSFFDSTPFKSCSRKWLSQPALSLLP